MFMYLNPRKQTFAMLPLTGPDRWEEVYAGERERSGKKGVKPKLEAMQEYTEFARNVRTKCAVGLVTMLFFKEGKDP